MKNLLKKELKLCLHPLVFVILLTPFITFVDVYPHMLTYLYMTIGVFMISLKCRENNDILYFDDNLTEYIEVLDLENDKPKFQESINSIS